MTSPEPARPGLRPSPPPQAPAPGSLGVATAILALLALVLYHRQLLLGSTFLLRDQLIYTWTERKLLADALRAGRLPEWNDLVGFGTQFAASSANGLTYPPLWLVAVLPLPFAMDLVTALHVLLAGAGAAAFARRLGAGLPGMILAGAGLMACGYVASIAPNKVFAGTAWLPWIAWAADRVARAEGGLRSHLRAGWPLAAVLGAQLLAGDPAASVTGGLLAGVVILARSSRRGLALASLAAASGGAVVLGAASVLPGLALLPHTSRASLSLAEGAAWSLHPLRLLELVWPRLLGSPVDPRLDLAELLARTGPSALEPSWSHSLFVGGPILGLFALAVLRRRPGSGALAAGALALTVLALGTFTPAYAVFRATLPLEAITRYPEKHLAGALVLVLALAGAGLSSLERERWRLAAGALGAGTALLALPLALAGALRPRLLASLERAAGLSTPPVDGAAALGIALRAGLAALAVAAVAAALLAARARAGRGALLPAIAVALLVGHATYEGWAVTPVTPAAPLEQVPLLLRPYARPPGAPAAPPPRLLRSPLLDAGIPLARRAEYLHQTLYLDGVGRFGFAAVPGFEGWRSERFARFWAGARSMALADLQGLYGIEFLALPRSLRDGLLPPGAAAPGGLAVELELDASSDEGDPTFGWTLVPAQRIRPRAFVAPRWRWVPEDEAVAELTRPERARDPGLVVLSGALRTADEGAPGVRPTRCELTGYVPEQVALRCGSPAGGYAVLIGESAPGWSATVDGRETPLATADALLLATRVGPGEHEVVFGYRTPLLRAGALLSALSWLALLGWALRRGRRPAAHA